MSELWPIARKCECLGGRVLPLRLHAETARLLAEALGEKIRAFTDHVLADYRCPKCKAIVEITVGECLRRTAA